MDLSPAPFHQLVNSTETAAEAYWLRSDDDIRLRVALWRAENPVCTVLLFPGRTEYVEKYAPIGDVLTGAGCNVLGIDWRGQGMADRLQDNPRPGHIGEFPQYQLDVVAMVEAAAALNLPEPWHLLAHSMGGGIGLAALLNGLPVETATFSAPMWGINHAPMPQAVVRGLTRLVEKLGRGGKPAFGTGGNGTYVLDEPFTNNLFTGNSAHWARLVREAGPWPDLTLGGATYRWVAQALAECNRLAAEPSPDLPMLVSLGSKELVVSAPAIRTRAANWSGAHLLELEDGNHEIMFERPELRDRFLNAFLDHIGISSGA